MAEVGGAPGGDNNVDLELQILACMDALFNFNLAVDELDRRELRQQTSRRLLDDVVNSMSDGDRFVLSYPADVEAFQRPKTNSDHTAIESHNSLKVLFIGHIYSRKIHNLLQTYSHRELLLLNTLLGLLILGIESRIIT
ncbi:hypothetical protein CCACVL1_22757 [Corchorus capsularis]|uniref:Uncharacterized protein n=1 Tax=Corchorus capsularis TaxID=210143 RepID=A0A1R3GWS7_COCAP|nr:hypothetical protein CCACVL1_22757 [Corchorus capsularis]